MTHDRAIKILKSATTWRLFEATAVFAGGPHALRTGNFHDARVVRAVLAGILRDIHEMSYPDMAEAMQVPGHSSAIYAYRRWENMNMPLRNALLVMVACKLEQ